MMVILQKKFHRLHFGIPSGFLILTKCNRIVSKIKALGGITWVYRGKCSSKGLR